MCTAFFNVDIMFLKKLSQVLIFKLFLYGDRKLSNGQSLNQDKPYMVYITKAAIKPSEADVWLCGGAIIHASFVLTAAACLEDVAQLYVIAGYIQRVKARVIKMNECTQSKKKKVLYTYVPKTYLFDYNVTYWSLNDIAVAQVDTPYDFNDKSYTRICSYTPKMVDVNFDPKNEEIATSVIVSGWGHLKHYRTPSETTDYNQEILQTAHLTIENKDHCKKAYSKAPHMKHVIDKYMICAIENNLVTSVNNNQNHRNGSTTQDRKLGICQNDHGGPLVRTVGHKNIVIGVASVFRIDKEKSECTGPYLFTSTYKNMKFLTCILNGTLPKCDKKKVTTKLPENEDRWYRRRSMVEIWEEF